MAHLNNLEGSNVSATDDTCPMRSSAFPYESVRWIRKRFQSTARTEYKNSKLELRKNYEIENVFNRFDEDGSKTLDVNELFEMFQ